jgi:hypothetical protein
MKGTLAVSRQYYDHRKRVYGWWAKKVILVGGELRLNPN